MSLQEEKRAMRKEIKKRFAIYSKEALDAHSEAALHKLETEPAFVEAEAVMLFWSLPDEVDTHAFIEKWSKEKTILLPVITGDKINPCVYKNAEEMDFGPFHISEPRTKVFEHKIDLVVVPGQAFDKAGHRLGRGKGFYDRFLTNFAGKKIGLCYKFQYIDYVPSEKFDIQMDQVVFD